MSTTFGWEGRPDEVFSAREEEYDLGERDEAEFEEEDDEDEEEDNEDEEEYGEFDDEESADEFEKFDYYEDTYGDDEVSPRRRRREWE